MSSAPLPYPPLELANRVGSLQEAEDPIAYYDEIGRRTRSEIVDNLPPDWDFAGKRVLDFGCGAGRTLRHFVAETAEAEVWGCDLDEPSIAWLRDHLSPPFQVFLNDATPPLDQPSSSFDLIWGISVFTHLTDSWSHWLVELHRVLDRGGLLFLTFMGSGMSEIITGESWDESKIGMNVLKYGQSWDLGGPMVMHSPWWIEEHWGRGFEIVSLTPEGFAAGSSIGHGSVLMRKRDVPVSAEMFERPAPGDTREAPALAHAVAQLQAEALTLRNESGYFNTLRGEAVEQTRSIEAQTEDLRQRLATLEASRSWRLTRPLRAIAHRIRLARR
jgi:SAM-dependent methyltransferase